MIDYVLDCLNMNTETDKDRLIESALILRSEGKTNTEISKIINVPRSTLHDWIGGSNRKIVTEITDDDGDVVYTKIIDSITQNEDDVLEFLKKLSPTPYKAPVPSKVRKSSNKIAVVIGDLHFGMEDENTMSIFFETVRELQPEKVILNGDTMDMFALSKYPKDPRKIINIEDEKDRYHKFLKILHDITEPWDAEILETNANHSGNGKEGRLWRYISQNIPSLAGMKRVQEVLSYENIFFPQEDWSRIKLVDQVVFPTNFIVMHGTVVRKNGGMSARGEFEKIYASTLTNHTHRLGSTPQTFPAVGDRKSQVFVNYENGCACNLTPDYVQCPNWQNGFSIIRYTDDLVGVDQVVVHGDKAIVNSLGKTIYAS
jgi:hypothetical protein